MWKLLQNRSFLALTISQSLGAFNDNAFKQFILLACLMAGSPLQSQESSALLEVSQPLGNALFAVPFLLFSVFAGSLADRFPKRNVIWLANLGEVAVMGCAAYALSIASLPLLFACVFAMGLQSAMFGPAKYGSIPELVRRGELVQANGLIQMTTFVAILGGLIWAGFLSDSWVAGNSAPGLAFVLLALLGSVISLGIRRQPAAAPQAPLAVNPFRAVAESLSAIRDDRPLRLSILAGGVFLLIASASLVAINRYGEWQQWSGGQISGCVAALTLGVGAGSLLAGRLSRGRIETGLVPLGLIGMGLSMFAIGLRPNSMEWLRICLVSMGMSAGLFSVPIRALIQQRPLAEVRGRIIGLSEFADFVGVLLGAGLVYGLDNVLGWSPLALFRALGALSLVFAVVSLVYTVEFAVRLVLLTLMHTFYSIRVKNLDEIPRRGGALLVCNHVSYVDGLLVGAVSHRRVRFLLHRRFFSVPLFGRFARKMGAIPVSSGDSAESKRKSLDEAIESIKAGHVICIFAEGAITRTGALLGFRRGLEVIARAADCPIIPIALNGVWGSIFSFEGGGSVFKWPSKLPYPVELRILPAMPSQSSAWEVRQRISEELAQARIEDAQNGPDMCTRLVRSAKRHAGAAAVKDSSGAHLSYRELLLKTLVLERYWKERAVGERMAVMLPPSAAGAVANTSLAFANCVAANLNYTLDNADLRELCDEADLKFVLTSRKFLAALDRSSPLPEERTIYFEDVPEQLTKAHKLSGWLRSKLPAWLLTSKWLRGADASAQRPLALLFSSGSTSKPKGIVLSHAAVGANVRGVSELLNSGPKDCFLGVLPFFHSFGYTATLWTTLLSGASAVFHPNPVEGAKIAKLSRKHQVTILLGAPTFFQAWMRRAEPEDFANVRLTVVGAERLPEKLASAWYERFGTRLLEGYGCTELAPVVSVNVPDVELAGTKEIGHKPGTIGRALSGVALKVVDPDDFTDRGQGEEGLLLVKSPALMSGYLNQPERTAEVVRDGWYVTGDIVRLDREGFLTITDRLSRFAKIGGEMVPHGRVEVELWEAANRLDVSQVSSSEDEEPAFELAVTSVPCPKKGERLIVLHNLGLEPANWLAELRKGNLPNLFQPRPENFQFLPSLPRLGSGKLNLGKLKELAQVEHS